MWTAKRILILLAGLAVFLSGYGVYAFFLGGIDGLPQLPASYFPEPGDGPLPPLLAQGEIDRKLEKAFGKECPEIKREIKLDLRSRGWGLAADKFDHEPDGRIKLTPFSAFLIPKKQNKATDFPEINTIRCDEAYLTLDKPISNTAELSNRRVVAVELRMKPLPKENSLDSKKIVPIPSVTIKNNRGTPETSDDVEVFIAKEPLFYKEDLDLIWSDGMVRLLDKQTAPHPTMITARGMEMHLSKTEKTAASHGKNKKKDVISGVDLLILNSNVRMDLYVDPRNGFLANSNKESNLAADSPPPEKSHMVIQTAGKFGYDLQKDWARFDSPKVNPKSSLPHDQVSVIRDQKINGQVKMDKLTCDHLELQFRRKPRASTPPEREGTSEQSGSIDKEIENAHATALPGELVNLVMESDKLKAYGSEMIYVSPTETVGPTTMIKGQPLHAVKDNLIIECQELEIVGNDNNGQGQRTFAKGPGQIDIFDKNNPTHHPWHALWKDTMTSVKDREGAKVFDLLTFIGEASFIDEERKQELHGQRLLVWLEPAEPPDLGAPADSPKQQGSEAPRQRPAKVDAYDQVKLRSPDMNVTRADHLKILFTDDLSPGDILPESKEGLSLALPGSTPAAKDNAPKGQTQASSKDQTAAAAAQSPDKAKQPIDLEAREVVAYVSRFGSQNFLRELVSEGAVHVHQNGATPQDKGVDILGEMLNLVHHPLGDTLYVFGDSRKPAQLQLGELILIGPKVTINQRDNVAEVEGIGAMQMPSNTSFDSGKKVKPGTRITVHWNKDMFFDGKHAEFHGGVQAYQDNASLRCQNLEVTLDRAVSFKEGQKEGQNAKVEIMVCDRKVFVVDEKRDDKGNLLSYHRLEATQARLDNPLEMVTASGTGKVYILATGSSEVGPGPLPDAKQPPKAPPPQQLQLTRIHFLGRMFSNNKENVRTSKFYDNVEVYHCPADRPDVDMSPDRPPKDGFYMRSDMLIVYTRTLPDGKSYQLMEAHRRVNFRTPEYYGIADILKYNESRDTVLFQGTDSNPAKLYQYRSPGGQPREIQGSKILYNRRTGAVSIDGGIQIDALDD